MRVLLELTEELKISVKFDEIEREYDIHCQLKFPTDQNKNLQREIANNFEQFVNNLDEFDKQIQNQN